MTVPLSSSSRVFWWCFGIVTQLIFAVTVWHLFWFFKRATPEAEPGALWIDWFLALQFAVMHSVLLHRIPRGRLERWIPPPAYGTFFALVTSLSVLLVCLTWQSSPVRIWDLKGVAGLLVELAYYGSWLALMYSISLTGFGWQTGFTTWWPWIRGKAVPRRNFAPRGAYLLIRHPVYLSFMGLIWFTPVMSLDRLVLAVLWTLYIFIGSWLKDQRLLFYLGDRYRRYQEAVPGYPGMIGPLGRTCADSSKASVSS